MTNITDIISQLEAYDSAYEEGNSIVPDAQYDNLKKTAFKAAPNHPYFMRVGADVRGGKIKLPYTMGSLDQIYEGDYLAWCIKYALQKKKIVVSHKLDGVSCMVQYKNGDLQVAYSRGNGVEGADITRHVKKVKNIPLKISTMGHVTIRGELIMSNDKFEQNWASTYANPRNMVAGLFNRKETDEEAIADVDFIAYQTVSGSDDNVMITQLDDLDYLKKLGFQVVEHDVLFGEDLNDTVLSKLLAQARRRSAYELDGIVLTINEKGDQKNLSKSSSLNPEHSVKYKVLDQNSNVLARVVKVHWELSKHGYFKPRVEIDPIKLMGVTITFATGFNGKYIYDNQIGPNTQIKITRSGQVIPYITEIVKATQADMPKEKWEWNDNKVEILAPNADSHPLVVFKQALDFFQTLNVDLLKEASLAKVVETLGLEDKPYEQMVATVMSLLEMEWEHIIGSNGSKIYLSLERRLANLSLATYLGSVKFFGPGFGVRKSKMLLKNLKSEDHVWDLTVADIMTFEGFDTKTAQAFVNGLQDAREFSEELGLSFVQEVKGTTLAHLNVVFTGFRDNDLQEALEKAGAKVGSSVSKKTTHLITAEPNSTSTKAKKAREIGVKTLSVDEFKDEFNL